jgi:hypothetical protein
MVELSLHRIKESDGEELLIQPRILARTREVVRAVVEVRNLAQAVSVEVTTPPTEHPTTIARKNITADEFFEALARKVPNDVVSFARAAIERAPDHQLYVDWLAAGPMFKYVDPDTGKFFSFGQFTRDGEFSGADWLDHRFRDLSLPMDACKDYLEEVASIFPGASARPWTDERKDGRRVAGWELQEDPRRGLPLRVLATQQSRWFAAIDRAIERIKTLMKARS